jgi:hypothetical protein
MAKSVIILSSKQYVKIPSKWVFKRKKLASGYPAPQEVFDYKNPSLKFE